MTAMTRLLQTARAIEPTTKAALDWSNLGHQVRRQLPNVRLFDSVVGAGVGAGAGSLYHALAGEDEADRRKGRSGLWRRMLTGAGLGAVGGNVVGDRARRYFSNLPDVQGYDPKHIWQQAKGHGFQGFVDGALIDRPILNRPDAEYYDPAGPQGGWTDLMLLRRELMRRGMGVHTASPDTDYFQSAGTMVGRNGHVSPRVEINSRFYDKTDGKLNEEGVRRLQSLFGRVTADAPDVGAVNGTRNPGTYYSSVLGGHPREQYGDVQRITDLWDVEPEPGVDAAARRYLKDWWKDSKSLDQPLAPDMQAETFRYIAPGQVAVRAGDRRDALKSWAGRKLFNNVVFDEPVMFDQSFYNMGPKADNQGAVPTHAIPAFSGSQGGPDDQALIDAWTRRRTLWPTGDPDKGDGFGHDRPYGLASRSDRPPDAPRQPRRSAPPYVPPAAPYGPPAPIYGPPAPPALPALPSALPSNPGRLAADPETETEDQEKQSLDRHYRAALLLSWLA